MDKKNKRVLLFAKIAVAVPASLCLLVIILSGVSSDTSLFLAFNVFVCIFSVKDYIQLKSGRKNYNNPFIMAIIILGLFLSLLIAIVWLAAIISGEPILPAQR